MGGKGILRIDEHPSEGVKALLDNNVIGTPGRSMVYQHGRAAEKYGAIPRPFFVSLVRKKRVLGTCCFCERKLLNGGNEETAYYARYFTFHPAMRKLGDIFLDRKGSGGALRKEVEKVVTGGLFPGGAKDNFFYAYVDQGNERSRRFTESFGFRKIGSFTSLVFSRFYPSTSARVVRLSPEQWKAFKPELLNFYGDHRMVTDENLYFGGNYFAVIANGRVVAGLQANPERWKVHDMPGVAGRLMMKVFPRIGLLSKLFNPDYRFVAVEGVYFQPGYAQELETLLQHVLALNGVNSAVICLDPSSKVYRQVKKLRLGLVSRLRKEKAVDVIARANGIDISRQPGPLYISAVDVT